MGYSTKGITYKVLNRRTCLIEENFDVTFNDLFFRNPSQIHTTSHIVESDIPYSIQPIQQVIVNIDFESLFGLPEIALDADVILLTEPLLSTNSSRPLPFDTSTREVFAFPV